jgi:hypothetical protein
VHALPTCTEARDGVMPSEMPLLRANLAPLSDIATGVQLLPAPPRTRNAAINPTNYLQNLELTVFPDTA